MNAPARLLLIALLLMAVGSLMLLNSQPQPVSANHLPYNRGDIFAGVGMGIIERFSPTGTHIEDLNTTTGSNEQTGMCFDDSGNLYTTNWNVSNMSKFNNLGGLLIHPWGNSFVFPESCVVDAAGYIYTGEGTLNGTNYRLRKWNSSGVLQAQYIPAIQNWGIDWIDLADDQCTMYYTSRGGSIKRFNVCNSTQLSDFRTGLTGICYALRIRPNGEVVVACSQQIYHLSTSGSILHTYSASTYRAIASKLIHA